MLGQLCLGSSHPVVSSAPHASSLPLPGCLPPPTTCHQRVTWGQRVQPAGPWCPWGAGLLAGVTDGTCPSGVGSSTVARPPRGPSALDTPARMCTSQVLLLELHLFVTAGL